MYLHRIQCILTTISSKFGFARFICFNIIFKNACHLSIFIEKHTFFKPRFDREYFSENLKKKNIHNRFYITRKDILLGIVYKLKLFKIGNVLHTHCP